MTMWAPTALGYWVSPCGQVKSATRVLRSWAHSGGYRCVTLKRRGERKNEYVHRLVAAAFLDRGDDQGDVNHKDGDKTNNAADNLEWCTRSENMMHKTRVLRKSCRDTHPGAKLTFEKAREIRALLASGETPVSLFKRYNVSEQTIRFIGWGTTWKEWGDL